MIEPEVDEAATMSCSVNSISVEPAFRVHEQIFTGSERIAGSP